MEGEHRRLQAMLQERDQRIRSSVQELDTLRFQNQSVGRPRTQAACMRARGGLAGWIVTMSKATTLVIMTVRRGYYHTWELLFGSS